MQKKLAVGDEIVFEKTVSESDVYLYAGLSGDLAANHINERYMAKTHYGQRVAHGLLALSYAATPAGRLAELYGVAGVSMGYDRVRFVNPVFIGDTIRACLKIDEIDTERGRVYADVTAHNQNDKLVMAARHVLKIFSGIGDEEG